jgi:hypothetical protein
VKQKKEDFRVKTDMKANEKLPEIIDRLENEISIKYSKIKKEFIINDIEDFAKEIQEFGKEYNLNQLVDWGKKLFEQASDFDLENLSGTLNDFGDILNKIKNFQKE